MALISSVRRRTIGLSGYTKLYADCVLQADRGVDFDFLVGCRGHAIPRESH
jgi:L-arabonate dehydrase